MKGNKFLAAALAASMVFSTVPATALNVFADSVSVEASDTQATASNTKVTVAAGSYATEDDADALLATLTNKKDGKLKDDVGPAQDSTGAFSATASVKAGDKTYKNFTEYLQAEVGSDYTVADVTITDTTNGDYSFTITENAANKTYTVTVANTPAADKVLPTAIKQELDYYFTQKTFDVYNGASLTAAYIASQAQTELKADSDGNSDTIKKNSNFAIKGDTTKISDDGTVTLKVTVGTENKDKDIDYTASIKLNKIDGSQDAAITAAINAVNGNTYAFTTENNIKAKVAKDLVAAGWKTAAASSLAFDKTSDTYYSSADVAKRDRKIVVTANSDATKVFTITLTKSSTQKMDETKKSIEAVTDFGSADGTATKAVVEKGKDAVGEKSFTVKTNSTISLNTQNVNATEAASVDDAVKAVKDAIDAKLTADKDADNGVTVEVSAVDETLNPTLKHQDAIVGKLGYYYVLVKASIANDFADWDVTGLDATDPTVAYYVVKVNTAALKEIKATAVSIDDQTAVFKTSGVKNNGDEYMAIPLNAVLTPENANSNITYTVTKKSGTGTGYIGGTSSFKVTDKDNNDVTSTSTLYVSGAGVFTVTATANGKTDTATITVKSNFNDVPANSYYATAVADAYAGDVTSGTSATTFSPNANVTRGQFVTLLYNYAVKADSSVAIDDDDVKEVFSDVATSKYYAKAIQWASENGIADGVGNGKFDPDADVTRAQAITFIYRALGKSQTEATGEEGENTTQFTDVTSGAYYLPAVTWGVNKHVVSGLSTTTYGPDQDATRAQAITFIARTYGSTGDVVFTHPAQY